MHPCMADPPTELPIPCHTPPRHTMPQRPVPCSPAGGRHPAVCGAGLPHRLCADCGIQWTGAPHWSQQATPHVAHSGGRQGEAGQGRRSPDRICSLEQGEAVPVGQEGLGGRPPAAPSTRPGAHPPRALQQFVSLAVLCLGTPCCACCTLLWLARSAVLAVQSMRLCGGADVAMLLLPCCA